MLDHVASDEKAGREREGTSPPPSWARIYAIVKPALSAIARGGRIDNWLKKGAPRMLASRTLVAIVLAVPVLLFPIGRSLADERSPEAFLEEIYDTYKGNSDQAHGISLDTDVDIQRYFEPSLAALIVKDREEAAKLDEAPELDGDPFVDAQDWQIEGLKIVVARSGRDKATGTVTFRNFDQPEKIVVDLVKIEAAWKISNIRWSDGTLRDLVSGQ
jgi:hypothetical protein